jgi:hypothetical protein
MIALLKALIPGVLLTWIVASVLGTNGSKGGFLYVHQLHPTGNSVFSASASYIYWSWPLFFAATGLAFAIFKLQE